MSIHATSPSEPSCPRCGASPVVRWGWVRTVRSPPRRRFRCNACGRTFSEHTGRPLAGTWYPNRWPELCRELVEQSSVRLTARRLGISPSTAFRWRHRVLQTLADHRERAGFGQLGSGGSGPPPSCENPDGAELRLDRAGGSGDGTGGAGRSGAVGVMASRFKVAVGRGPELEPLRFFRVLVGVDAVGRVALDLDVPGEIAGPPGSPLPLCDWVLSDRAVARFPLQPADRVPSPRRLLTRWCAPGCEIFWMGWPFYEWSKLAAEFGMIAVRWTPRRARSDESSTNQELAVRARNLAVKLKDWLCRYQGVSTRWLRGYLALFAELAEAALGKERRRVPAQRSRWRRAVPEAAPEADWARRDSWHASAWIRFCRQARVRLAWRLLDISVRGMEGPEAYFRRGWIR